MTISYQWLCDYLPVRLSTDECSTILTSVGLEVEHVEKKEAVKGGLQGLLIGKMLECSQHPNADKLKLTLVDLGLSEPLPIVCGAPNVAAGQTVVVAPVGTMIHPLNGEPFQIKAAKIRGEESRGMICAEDEIGLGESHDGIIVIKEDIKPGTPAKEYYKIPEADTIFEIGLTPNRMDAMSHLGVTKDICAYLSHRDQKTAISKVPAIKLPELTGNKNVEIIIEDQTRCARYAGICIVDVKVIESPEWMQQRLKAIGLRPINVIVDITNYVLHECGQPLHAFDLNAIKGNKVIVKTLPEHTKFVTLDEKERSLHPEDLMICDSEGPLCIAGVFGGLHSGVSANTTDIFLESAWFENNSVRKTSLRHGLRTDAAIRFEKGADISQVPYALQRAAQLICELAGGKLASPMTDIYPQPFTPRQITLYFQKVNELAGKVYPPQEVKQILSNLCFGILEEDEEKLSLQVPFSKPDISMQADVVEEIMRIDGLDNIPFTGRIAYTLPASTGYKPQVKNQVAQLLTGKGFKEIFTNSITNSAYYPEHEGLVKMMNNLSAELDCMRPSMLETGLQAVAYNLNRKNLQLNLFEFGSVYSVREGIYKEETKLCLYLSGNYRASTWKEKEQAIDLYYVKGVVEGLVSSIKPVWQEENEKLHLLFQNRKVGFIEGVNAAKKKQFDLRQDVWFVELDWTTLQTYFEKQKPRFKALPKFPLMQRDLALIIDRQVSYADVQKSVKLAKSKLLQDINLFDVFESDKLGKGKKSYAINLSFYNDERTLTDGEVEQEMKQIVSSLEKNLGAAIRGNA